MKKNIVNLIIATLFFTAAANAQQGVIQAQAVINADGSRVINITDASGKTTKVTAGDDATLREKYLDAIKQQAAANAQTATEQKPQIIGHRAVLGLNGKQQIIMTYASGKEVAIDAVEGQSIQETYLAYLKKEGLACGCSPVAAPADSGVTTRTATRSGTIINQ